MMWSKRAIGLYAAAVLAAGCGGGSLEEGTEPEGSVIFDLVWEDSGLRPGQVTEDDDLDLPQGVNTVVIRVEPDADESAACCVAVRRKDLAIERKIVLENLAAGPASLSLEGFFYSLESSAAPGGSESTSRCDARGGADCNLLDGLPFYCSPPAPVVVRAGTRSDAGRIEMLPCNSPTPTETPTSTFTATPTVTPTPTPTPVPPEIAMTTDFLSGSVSLIDLDQPQPAAVPVPVGAAPLGIAVAPDNSEVYVALASTLAVIDTATLRVRVLEQTETLAAPRSVAVHPSDGRVFLTDAQLSHLAVYDAKERSFRDPFDLEIVGAGVAVRPQGDFAYVSHDAFGYLSRIDLSSGEVEVLFLDDQGGSGSGTQFALSAVTIAEDGSIHTCFDCRGIAVSGEVTYVSPAGADPSPVLYVIGAPGAVPTRIQLLNGLNRVAGGSPALSSLDSAGDAPAGMATSLDGRRVFIANVSMDEFENTFNRLWIVDPANDTRIASIPVGDDPRCVAVGRFFLEP